MLKHFGVTPYLVFDGGYLPSKAGTEASRGKRRDESKKLGLELIRAGKPAQAFAELQKAIDVTPEMARQLMEELKKDGVAYVVAPYEADAQLVYLERQGLISGIISEDSDLLVFGAKRLLTKLDNHGQCVEINRRDFCACREISLTGWSDAEFRQMAILSGCDYLEGVSNMGLKTAYRMLRKYKSVDRLVRMLQFDGKYQISENYLAAFKQAEFTFLHQRVFCPTKQEMVLLTEPESSVDVENMPFIGAPLPAEVARGIATGDLHPMTKQPLTFRSSSTAPNSAKRRLSHPPTVSKGIALSSPAPQNAAAPPKKPIDSYFKGGGRVPLGAMDPNCFTVEPQRVAALTQNGLLPRVFPLPRPYLENNAADNSNNNTGRHNGSPRLLRRRTEPVTNLIGLDGTGVLAGPSSSQAARRRTAGPATAIEPRRKSADADSLGLPPPGRTTPRPPKKARLCEEGGAVGAEQEEALKSKYFGRVSPKKAAKNTSEGYLMSDSSVDDILRALPDDMGEWHRTLKSQKSVDIFAEPEPPLESAGSEAPFTVDSTASDLAAEPASAIHISDTTSTADQPCATETPLRTRLQHFSYNRTRISNGLPTPSTGGFAPTPSSSGGAPTPSSTIPSSSASAAFKKPLPRAAANNKLRPAPPPPIFSSQGKGAPPISSAPATPATPLFMTPLQRLGARALNRPVPSGAHSGSPVAKQSDRRLPPSPPPSASVDAENDPSSSSSRRISSSSKLLPPPHRHDVATIPAPLSSARFTFDLPFPAKPAPAPLARTASMPLLRSGAIVHRGGSEDLLGRKEEADDDDDDDENGGQENGCEHDEGEGAEVDGPPRRGVDFSRFLFA